MQPTTPTFPMNDEHQRLLAAAIMASSGAQFRCDRCPFQAASAEQLAAHISVIHGAVGQRTCGECGITLATKSQWQEHLRTYHNHRNQGVFSKSDYANIFSSLANNGAAALTAAHLIMAAAANGSGGAGYDLNLLASAAALASPDTIWNQQQQPQHARGVDQTKTTDLGTTVIAERESEEGMKCQRYYACVYDCDFAARSSRQYLHHLRDEHGEKFAIFYCDQCDDYATKFVARLRTHKALVHDGDKSVSVDKEERSASRPNGTDAEKNGHAMHDEEDDDDVDTRKLSIVVDQQHTSETNGDDETGEEEMDGVFRCMHCPYATNELPRFKKHAKCHETTVDTRCQYCNFRTVYSWNLDRHVRCHRQAGKYTCRRCSFSQNTRQSMQFHLQHHHDDVSFATVETQTEADDGMWDENVDVGFEVFIFEKHAVRVNVLAVSENGKSNMEDDMQSDGGYTEVWR